MSKSNDNLAKTQFKIENLILIEAKGQYSHRGHECM